MLFQCVDFPKFDLAHKLYSCEGAVLFKYKYSSIFLEKSEHGH